jgi:hypothetical protein
MFNSKVVEAAAANAGLDTTEAFDAALTQLAMEEALEAAASGELKPVALLKYAFNEVVQGFPSNWCDFASYEADELRVLAALGYDVENDVVITGEFMHPEQEEETPESTTGMTLEEVFERNDKILEDITPLDDRLVTAIIAEMIDGKSYEDALESAKLCGELADSGASLEEVVAAISKKVLGDNS